MPKKICRIRKKNGCSTDKNNREDGEKRLHATLSGLKSKGRRSRGEEKRGTLENETTLERGNTERRGRKRKNAREWDCEHGIYIYIHTYTYSVEREKRVESAGKVEVRIK